MTMSVRVHENLLGHFLSSQIPINAKSMVGIATDQPTIPNILSPYKILNSFFRRAFILRDSFIPTFLLNSST